MDFLASIIPPTLMYSTPIIIAALGGLYSERSGIVNIAIEGLMLFGAFAAGASIVFLENSGFGIWAPWLSLLIALFAGMLVSVLHAYLSINLNSDQVISGTAINIFTSGITVYLCEFIFGQQRTQAFRTGLVKSSVPVLKDIPILGRLFFTNAYYTTYVGLFLVLLTWYILYKTPFGLRFRGTGENPHALDSLGINIYKMRYIGVLASGALSGLAGGIMVLTQNTQFSLVSIHGTGFIALAALIFGQWRPLGLLLAGLFFGFAQILSLHIGTIAENFNMPALNSLPVEFLSALPYVLTIIALIVFSSKTVGPKSAGQPYEKGKR